MWDIVTLFGIAGALSTLAVGWTFIRETGHVPELPADLPPLSASAPTFTPVTPEPAPAPLSAQPGGGDVPETSPEPVPDPKPSTPRKAAKKKTAKKKTARKKTAKMKASAEEN